MTYHPEYYFDALGKIGVDMISFHQEAVIHVDRTIHDIKSRGIKAGIALNPGTSPVSYTHLDVYKRQLFGNWLH